MIDWNQVKKNGPAAIDWSHPAPPPVKPPEQNPLQKIKSWVKHADKSPVVNAMTQYAQLPAEGINAVLGAPQRIIASRIANAKTNPGGVIGAFAAPMIGPAALLQPDIRQQLGHEVYAAFHPNDPTIEDKAEKTVGVNRLMTTDPRFRGKVQNFLVRTGFENLTDPLNWATAGTMAAGEVGLKALGRAGTRALNSSDPVVRNTAGMLLTNPTERQGGFAEHIPTINSIRQKAITKARVQHTADADLLAKNAKALKMGVVPDEVRQRLLQEPYVYGTPEMRKQAVAFGFKPTEEQAAKPPESLLNYNLRENYDPHTGFMKSPVQFNDALVGEEETLRAPTAGMEKEQTGHADVGTLYDRMVARLAQGRGVIRHRMTAQDLLNAGVTSSPEMAFSLATQSKVKGAELLKAISRAQVDALTATGLPHMKNVGIEGFNAMGEVGLAKAGQYFVTGIPKKLTLRLEEGGGSSHFGIRTPGTFSPARLVPRGVRKVSTGALDRWDQALRAARLEQVDKQFPNLTEYEKMDRVNQDLGAYNLQPRYTELLRGFTGANFPQWHTYIVPTTVGRAIMRNPGRVERLSRAEQNANDEFMPNSKYRVTLGGPNDEFASAAADPARRALGKYPSYFGGPSAIGVLSNLHSPEGVSPGMQAAQYAAGFIPFGGTMLDLLANPYKSPLPPAERAAGSLAGIYTQKRPKGSLSRTRTPAAPIVKPSGGINWQAVKEQNP